MTLATSFAHLEQTADGLEQVFGNLRWAAVQAQPEPGQGPAVVDHWETAAQDTADLARESHAAAREGRLAANGRFDPIQARRALAGCQGRFNDLWLRYSVDLASFERQQALADVRQRDDDWANWAAGVVDALDQCPQALYDLNRMLGHCWEELVDRSGVVAVSVQATATGQEIRVARKGTSRKKRSDVAPDGPGVVADLGS